MSLNWVDIAIVVVLLASTAMGFFWGLIRQLVSIFGLAGGIFMAGRFYQQLATTLNGENGKGLVTDPGWARIIAFAIIVIGFSLVVGLIGAAMRFTMNLIFLGWLDHLLGGVLGLLTAAVLLSSLLVAGAVFPVPNVSQAIRESHVAQWLGGFTPLVLALLPPEFQIFRQMMGWGPK